MKSGLAVISATALATLAISLAPTPAAQGQAVDLTGAWYGVGQDLVHGVPDGMTVSWTLTQTGSTVSGTVKTTGLNGIDGSCSGCHREKAGTISGTVSGTTFTLAMAFPFDASAPSPACTATYNGTAQNIATGAFTTTYSGNDICESIIANGSVNIARDPSISTQPASQTIASGRTATLSAVALGTATLNYQWYLGPSGSITNLIAGATSSSYTSPPLTSATSYWVRATNAKGSVDSATATLSPIFYQPFTDDALTAGSSLVRAVHITELRSRIDALRSRFVLPVYSYTDLTLAAGTGILTRHITDLRTALSEVYVKAVKTPPTYTDDPLTAGTVMKAVHISEIRSAVIAIE